jgi:DNA-binding response OmpR family regulator
MADAHPASLFIVEDEALVFSLLRRAAEAAGFEVTASAATVADALAQLDALSARIDAVLLDANLRGVSSAPVAERLRAAGVPYLVITGYSEAHVAEIAGDRAVLRKPVKSSALVAALRSLRQG